MSDNKQINDLENTISQAMDGHDVDTCVEALIRCLVLCLAALPKQERGELFAEIKGALPGIQRDADFFSGDAAGARH